MSNPSMTVLETVAAKYADSGSKLYRDFDDARRRAVWRRFRSIVRGQRNHLLWLAERRDSVGPLVEHHGGFQTIDVDRIVGSESRAEEFNRDFLPRKKHLDRRWSRVNGAFHDDVALPPIQVFELRGDYYVRDGNHRVSVAKYHGVKCIRAEIIRLDDPQRGVEADHHTNGIS